MFLFLLSQRDLVRLAKQSDVATVRFAASTLANLAEDKVTAIKSIPHNVKFSKNTMSCFVTDFWPQLNSVLTDYTSKSDFH